MRFLKHRSVVFYLGLVLILAMTIGGSAIAAFADSGGASITLNTGTLTETGTFGESTSVTLNGTDQTPTYTLPITVTDARGSGAGWNLTISGTPLASGSHTLTQQVSAASAACPGGNGCTNAISSTSPPTYPVVIGSSAQKFFSADANSGMGIIKVTTTVQVLVPGNAFAGTYNTTLTLASVSGP